jgi:cell division protein FtsI (penicillin-binding protein 3)
LEIKKDILWRVAVVYFTFALVGIAIIGRIVYLQIAEGSIWREKQQKMTLRDMIIQPNRGDILAEDGRILATSVPYYDIRMDVGSDALTNDIFRANIDSLAYCLSRMFGDKPKSIYKSELQTARRQKERYFLVHRRVSYEQMRELKNFPIFRLGTYKGGLIVVQDDRRFQPHGDLASRTIGYLTKSESGNRVGVEGAYDNILGGKSGIRLMQRATGGVWMPVRDGDQVEPEDGIDVVTTIDINLQDVAEQALANQLSIHNAHHGTAILMEVKTGEIRAIANLEQDEWGRYRELYNYALGESTEPGSTFKLPALMAAIEDGYIDLDDTVNTGNGKFRIYDKEIQDTREGGYGVLNVAHVFSHSSNVGMAKLITRLYKGKEKDFIDRLYSFHLNEPLNLDLKGEGTPEIKYPGSKYWSGISLAMMSHGYEVRVTPLQILTFYNAVANNGKMMKPMFVKELRERGNTIKTFDPVVIDPSICSMSTIRKARRMLELVVDSGTAVNLRNTSLRIAGKTGTAQIANLKYGYDKVYLASFVGYFPADDPKYSCLVWVSSPSNSVYYGNLVAGPVFREISEKVYATRIGNEKEVEEVGWFEKVDAPYTKGGYLPELELVLDNLDIPMKSMNKKESQWVVTEKNGKTINYYNKQFIANLVPDVTGMGLKDALYVLENVGLQVVVSGKGTVTRQSILPGTRVRKGDTIYLEMSFS